MMNEEFHKPFIKSMIIVAFVTLIAMVSSKFVVEYYMSLPFSSHKTIEYSSHQSEENTESLVGE